MLLEYLHSNMPMVAITQWQTYLDDGLISINGNTALQDQVMSEGQQVKYTLHDYQEGEVDTRWSLLWQNNEIAAVHKPSNLPVSRTTRNIYNTLVQILRRESPWQDAHLLHRLDLETSGIILVGKDNASASKHQPNLSSLIQRKIYHAVVYGLPDWQTLDYECELNTIKDSPIRCQMHQVEKGKTSRTLFKVLKTSGDYSIIECELLTGRKHQIRAHLSNLGHAIVGDKIYSNGGEFYLKRLQDNITSVDHDALLTPHHLLHAYEVHLQPNYSNEGGDAEESKQVQKEIEQKQDAIVITDRCYSEAWHSFVKKHSLNE